MRKLLPWLLTLIVGVIAFTGFSFVSIAESVPNCQITTLKAKVGDGLLSYEQAGKGKPVLLLHGLFADKEQWEQMLCGLSQSGYLAIAPDLPGYGESTGFAVSDYALENQVKLIHEFTDGLGIKKLDLAASSMGGTIAHLYSQKYPQQIHSLAFIGAPLGIIDWSESLKKAIVNGINPFIPITIEQFDLEISLLFVTPPSIPDSVKKAKVEDYLNRDRHYQQVWNIVNLYDRIFEQAITTKLPTLIIWGEVDQIYNIRGAEMLKKRLVNSQLIKLANAGHLLLMENANQATSEYLKFLRQVPRY